MRQEWLLATRSWRVKPARTALSIGAVALGVAVVVWVTCCYESVSIKMTEVVLEWIGRSHIMVEPVEGRWAVFGAEIEADIAKLPAVAETTTQTREFVEAAVRMKLSDGSTTMSTFQRIEATGIRLDREQQFRTYHMSSGRFLQTGDRDAVVMEKLLADLWELSVGDELFVRDIEHAGEPRAFEVIGLVDRRRASANQPPMIWLPLEDVQSLRKLPGMVKSVDIILKNSDVDSIRGASEDIRKLIDRRKQERAKGGATAESLKVTSTEAQHQRLDSAQRLLRFIMMLLSCVVLLTGFFIILATVNMGLTERITEMGLLRCVGVTRRQLCLQVFIETAPIGLAGTAIGLALGFALQWITIQAARDYIGAMAISKWGVVLAIVGGAGTTLLGAIPPTFRALAVSPVEATRPSARPQRRWIAALAALAGAGLIGCHELVKSRLSPDTQAGFDITAVTSLLLLYAGFALMTPALVLVLGRVAVFAASAGLRLRPQLLGDEIDKAPYRSAAICSGLMVGLSLIVGLVVWGESVKTGWQFPKEFPEAILYAYSGVPLEKAESLEGLEGLKQFSAADDFPFWLKKPTGLSALMSVLDKFSRFIAIDPATAFEPIKLTYLEGNQKDAIEKLKAGGHLLITREFAQARDIKLGDKLTIWAQNASGEYVDATFTIAGVIASPGLDIAISFFNATGYYQVYSVGSIIGTLQDAKRLFNRSTAKLMFFNFDLPDTVKSESDPAATTLATSRAAKDSSSPISLGGGPVSGDGPEEKIVNRMLEKLGWPVKAFVTARQLKTQINRNIDHVTLLLSMIPLVALIVAGLGVANLMMANVAARSRQIAVLRSIGATQGQVARIVIGEAMVLGLLGSVAGLALGAYLGRTSNDMTAILTGYTPLLAVPWWKVMAGGLVATGMCVLSALLPARYASRSNIVAVLGGN